MPKSVEITFDGTALDGSNGVQSGPIISTERGFAISKVEFKKENNSTCKVNFTAGLKKRSIFGDNPVFCLRGDLSGLISDNVADGGDVGEWKSFVGATGSPIARIKATQGTVNSKPHYDIDMSGTSGLGGVQFSHSTNDEFMELPSATEFQASDFTCFVVTGGTFSLNSDSECHVLGALNASGTGLYSVWGMESGRRIVRDQSGNQEMENDNLWAANQIRMLSRDYSSDSTVEYLNGTELDDWSGFDGRFNFDYINRSITRSGGVGTGTVGIMEIIFYEDSHTTMGTAERQLIEGYLAHKYSLTANLPSGHLYKSEDPRGSGYDNRVIAGDYTLSPSTVGSFQTWNAWTLQTISAKSDMQLICTDINEPGVVTLKLTYVPL
tara:strand:+ start:61 stop:1203 length:1143 start_codon:yes stop_codon:yes gene_type:complete